MPYPTNPEQRHPAPVTPEPCKDVNMTPASQASSGGEEEAQGSGSMHVEPPPPPPEPASQSAGSGTRRMSQSRGTEKKRSWQTLSRIDAANFHPVASDEEFNVNFPSLKALSRDALYKCPLEGRDSTGIRRGAYVDSRPKARRGSCSTSPRSTKEMKSRRSFRTYFMPQGTKRVTAVTR